MKSPVLDGKGGGRPNPGTKHPGSHWSTVTVESLDEGKSHTK